MTFRFQREIKDHQKAITGNIWRQSDRYNGGIGIIFFLWALNVIGWLRQLAVTFFFTLVHFLNIDLSMLYVRKLRFFFDSFGRRISSARLFGLEFYLRHCQRFTQARRYFCGGLLGLVDVVVHGALACWSRGNLTTASLKASWVSRSQDQKVLIQYT